MDYIKDKGLVEWYRAKVVPFWSEFERISRRLRCEEIGDDEISMVLEQLMELGRPRCVDYRTLIYAQ